jgi:L-rhamnose mutarotase
MDIARICKLIDYKVAARIPYESHWQRIKDNFAPFRPDIFQAAPPASEAPQGSQHSRTVYSGFPTKCVRDYSAFLHGQVLNPATKNYEFEVDDEELNENHAVKEWCSKASTIVTKAFDNSNLASQFASAMQDVTLFGWPVLYGRESDKPDRDIYFRCLHIGDCYIGMNNEGIIDKMFRRSMKTADQAVEKWRHKRNAGPLPDKVIKAWEKGDPDTKFEFWNVVLPNDEYIKGSVNPKNFLFSSDWIYKETRQLIEKSGYHQFPFTVPTYGWVAGEDYPRGLCSDILPDAQGLHQEKKTLIKVAQLTAEPVIVSPDDDVMINVVPRGRIYFDPQLAGNHVPHALDLGGNYPITKDFLTEEKEDMKRAFQLDKLQVPDQNNMTAFQVREIIANNAKVLGPVWGSMRDGIDHLVFLGFGILARAGKIPKTPAVLQNSEKPVNLRIRYVSPLAKQQKAHEVQGLQMTVSSVLEWAKASESREPLDKIKWDDAVDKLADLDGTDPNVINDEDTVKKIREVRQKMAEERARAEMANMNADTVGKMKEVAQ